MDNYYQIIQTGHIGSVWALPADLLNLWMLEEGDMVNLRFGSANTVAIIYFLDSWNDGNTRQMGFSSKILENLAMPKNISVMVKPEGNNNFHLGPVIGILTRENIVTEKKIHYYKRSAIINKNNGLLYVFSGKDIDVGSRTIEGYYYDCVGDSWKNHRFPFPDVVIDRCYPNNYSYHEILEEGNGSKIFNKKNRIDKMEFFNALKCDSFLNNHIPVTQLIEEISDFEYFLGKYNEIYLKPVDSMRGIGIIHATFIGGDLLNYSYMKNGEICGELINTNDIFNVLENVAGCKRQYIMQRAIDSMEYKKGSFSIRTWAMKDGNGNWVMPGMDARGTYGNGFLTNISVGAKAIPLNDLFKAISPCLLLTKDQLIILLEDFTLKVAKVLDQEYGPLGILGLDIIIDKEGKIWLIEANGNPGKSAVIRQNEFFSWPTKVYQYPLAYATYLAGFVEDTTLKYEPPDLAPRHSFTNASAGLVDKILQEVDRLENNVHDEVEIKENTENLTMPDLATLQSPNKTGESSVHVAENKEQFNKTVVVPETKTLQAVGILEIFAPEGVGIEKHAGNLTVPVLLEVCGEPVLKSEIINDLILYEGSIPAKLSMGKKIFDSGSDKAEELVQKLFIPFQFISEVKGIKPEDNLQEKITVRDTSIMCVPGFENEILEETKIKLILKIMLQVDIMITRESINSIPA